MILRLTKILITIFIVNVPNERVTAQDLSKHVASSIDYANIALDLKSIEAQLAIGTQEGRDAAHSIYKKGAYSMPYADITLASPIDTPDIIKKGTEVSGKSSTGKDVTGVVMADAKKGESVIQVHYSYDADAKLNDQCFVGGIPTPVTDGCFQNEGDLVIGQNSYQYVYDIIADTHNNITLKSFSSEAESDMITSDGRYFALFRRYNKYYGRPDYANEWVTAAFSGTTTDLLDGNAKFDNYDSEGKAEAIVNGIAFLNIWMYVFRQMHFAHMKCLEACDGCVDESVEAWDRALALYTGSNTNSPSDNGMLVYKVVETMCEVFGTCDNNLNERVLKIFVDSRDNLSSSNCGPIETNIEQVESMMTVPLIQTLLYETYREDRFKDSSKKVEAKGAAAAAALLPRVAFCNSKWADVVYMNTVLGLDVGHTSYEVVKDAIERQYECMEISCDEVGGIVSPKGGYFDNAEPCGLPTPIEVAHETVASSIDYANIALDLKSIEAQLAIGTQEGRDAAYSIYTKGAYSMPYADITLSSPIDTPDIIKKGTEVSGKSSTGKDVTGVVMADAKKGESVIQVHYSYDADAKLNDQCFVGGIPTPVTDGCFQNEGDLVIGQNSYQYVYDIIADTHNNITLKSFSSEAESDMITSDGRYFALFRRYNKYYGRPDYADEWVTAAFSGTTTDLLGGNAKFDNYDSEGKAEAIVNGIAFLNIWMYVFRQMNFAHMKCLEACDGCVDESVEAWDRALALYTGSNTNSPSDNGMLIYTVVETMCEVFGTCDNNLNERVLKVFVDSRDNLSSSNCGPIETNIEQVESMMTVPLIQTLLYETYREDRFKDSSKKVEAKGAAAAAALLPRVAFCSRGWVDIVYRNTALGLEVDHTSYEAVKDAIERQYDCLEISCDEVGGIVSPKGGYFDNAEPCGLPTSTETVSKVSEEESPLMSEIQSFFNSNLNGKMIGLISGVVAGMFVCIVSLVCVLKRKRKRSSGLETNKTEEDKDREIL